MPGNFTKNYFIQVLIGFLSILAYVILLYFTPRSNFFETYGLFILLFAVYYYVVKKETVFSFGFCIALAVLLRLVAVFSLPALSDDYFRFIWDGTMTLQHVNVFEYTPTSFIALHPTPQLQYLFHNLIPESQEAYSVYPGILQYAFAFAAWIFPKNIYGTVVVMKFIIFTAECFTMYGLFLVAKSKKIPVRIILLYALNPFIIAELTGNVHFEALLICFLVYTFYFLEKEKIIPVALFWALAINTKILPLILAPLFLRYLGFWRFVKMGLLSAVIVLILFIPFINSEVVVNISDSIEKFYNLFEFNASFYYLFSWISELFSNADYTQQIATALGIISTVGILIISFRHFKKGALFEKAMWIFTLYFLGAAMVQPWYISTMVMFCVFSRFRFPLVFSLLIELSYFPYMLKEYNENMYLILAEYLLLFLFIFYERRQIRKGKVVICLPEQNVTSHST